MANMPFNNYIKFLWFYKADKRIMTEKTQNPVQRGFGVEKFFDSLYIFLLNTTILIGRRRTFFFHSTRACWQS